MDEARLRGERGLAEAIEECLGDWSPRSGVAVEIWALPSVEVPAPVAAGVLAALREALALVERASHARTVSVAVTVSGAGLRMTVSDDGTGQPWDVTELRARFAALGGRVSVNHVPGHGTTVSGVIPSARR
ncbi:hypothetical protein [Thermoactinospora rubra]|uniref:hypothetical protein n=1 Tax=Thermoactinospora rubra TaxID=1088767 RepID=UPI000A11096B|nr:hypothetical protein [Thermoactinospora rubra]